MQTIAHIVVGCSWKGNITKRDGKMVDCGHKHSTWDEALPCLARMRKERPGKCQNYRIMKIVWKPVLRN